MEMSTTAVIKPHIDADQLRQVAGALGASVTKLAFAGGSSAEEEHDDASLNGFAQRSQLFWAAILANLVLVEHGTDHLDIDLPWSDNRTMSLLERAGLPYAIARRLGSTSLSMVDNDSLNAWLDPCRRPQYRSAPTLEGLLRGVNRISRNTQSKKRLLPWVISDPHLEYRLDDNLSALPYAWLEDFIPRPDGDAALAARDQLVPLLRGVMKELVENSAAHAFLSECRPSTRLDLISGLERSVAFVSLTEGGRASFDRVHMVVMDAGVGIPRTVRRKVPGLTVPSEELLHRVLTGDWSDLSEPPLALVAGNSGLNWCRAELLPHARQAKLVVVTEDDSGGFVLGEIDASGTVHTSRVPDIPLRGTIGILTVALPRELRHRADQEPSEVGSAAATQLQPS